MSEKCENIVLQILEHQTPKGDHYQATNRVSENRDNQLSAASIYLFQLTFKPTLIDFFATCWWPAINTLLLYKDVMADMLVSKELPIYR